MKRLARDLLGALRVFTVYGYQWDPPALDVSTNADSAGDSQSRKSTSGCVIMSGKHIVRTWSKNHELVALSVIVKGSVECLGMRSLLQDFDVSNMKV